MKKSPPISSWNNPFSRSVKIGLNHHNYGQRLDTYAVAVQKYEAVIKGYQAPQQLSWQQQGGGNSREYESYGNLSGAPRTYHNDPYAQSSSNAPDAHSAKYYSDYDKPTPVQEPVPFSQYREYSLPEPLSRISCQPPAPRPLFEAAAALHHPYPPRPRNTTSSSFFNGNISRTSGPPKRPSRKRDHEVASSKTPSDPNVESKMGKWEPKDERFNGDEQSIYIDTTFLSTKTDDAAGLFEKCKVLGEARQRQFRYKMFRVLDTLNLNFVTVTEQQGTFAKTGTIHIKVMLKRFFPQFFFGEADGTEHEHANYSAIVNLALKLHDLGLLSCDTIQNFYNKKLRFKTEVFESARAKFKMLVDEVEQRQFSIEFKEGRSESPEEMQILRDCIKLIADKIRRGEDPDNKKVPD